MIANIWAELSAYSIPEILAVSLSLAYLFFASRNSRYCWPPAFIASIIFVLVMWQHGLLMDAALNAYYALMAVYGWVVWQAQDDAKPTANSNAYTAIKTLAARSHILALSVILMASLISGYWLEHNSSASFPYLDSLTTWASLYATWLLAQRVLENWLYWIAIDCLSIYLYSQKALFFTTVLFGIYTVIAILAFHNWRKQMQPAAQASAPPTTTHASAR